MSRCCNWLLRKPRTGLHRSARMRAVTAKVCCSGMGYTEYTHTAPASMMCERQRIAIVADAVAVDDVAVAVGAWVISN